MQRPDNPPAAPLHFCPQTADDPLVLLLILLIIPLAGLIGMYYFNNTRFEDWKELMAFKLESRASAQDVAEAKMEAAKVRSAMEQTQLQLLVRLGSLETRLARLESERPAAAGFNGQSSAATPPAPASVATPPSAAHAPLPG